MASSWRQVGVKNRWKIDPKRRGRSHIALGTFQEAPERESLIFHWFWEVLGGARHNPAISGGGLPDPLNQVFSRQTKHHWNWASAWAWARARAWARASTSTRARARTQGKWTGLPTYAVAQSAVADMTQNFAKNQKKVIRNSFLTKILIPDRIQVAAAQILIKFRLTGAIFGPGGPMDFHFPRSVSLISVS